ncbi:hypothetical protein RFI_33312, partial [Reticulomyxa filosa]
YYVQSLPLLQTQKDKIHQRNKVSIVFDGGRCLHLKKQKDHSTNECKENTQDSSCASALAENDHDTKQTEIQLKIEPDVDENGVLVLHNNNNPSLSICLLLLLFIIYYCYYCSRGKDNKEGDRSKVEIVKVNWTMDNKEVECDEVRPKLEREPESELNVMCTNVANQHIGMDVCTSNGSTSTFNNAATAKGDEKMCHVEVVHVGQSSHCSTVNSNKENASPAFNSDVVETLSQAKQCLRRREMQQVVDRLQTCVNNDNSQHWSGHPLMVECYLLLSFALAHLHLFEQAQNYLQLLKVRHHLLPTMQLKVSLFFFFIIIILKKRSNEKKKKKGFEFVVCYLICTLITSAAKIDLFFCLFCFVLVSREIMEIMENWDEIEPPPIHEIKSSLQQIASLYGTNEPSMWTLTYFFGKHFSLNT